LAVSWGKPLLRGGSNPLHVSNIVVLKEVGRISPFGFSTEAHFNGREEVNRRATEIK
jgi:hypothetical protein